MKVVPAAGLIDVDNGPVAFKSNLVTRSPLERLTVPESDYKSKLFFVIEGSQSRSSHPNCFACLQFYPSFESSLVAVAVIEEVASEGREREGNGCLALAAVVDHICCLRTGGYAKCCVRPARVGECDGDAGVTAQAGNLTACVG